jgi:hypothetical protein
MQPFIVNWTSSLSTDGTIGKTPIVLANLVTNVNSSSLTLTGRGTVEYGQIQQENFVRLLENFASKHVPTNPTVGQTWFSTLDNTLYVCAELATVPSTMQKYYTAPPLTWVKAGASSTTADVTSAIGYQPVQTVTTPPADTSGVLHFTTDPTGSVVNLTITQASSNTNGYLSSTTYNVFDSKVDSVSAAAPLSSTGGKTPSISITQATVSADGYLSRGDWSAFDSKVSSVTVGAPLSSTGGKTPAITIPKSQSGVDGYLSGVDWSTFYGKIDFVGANGPLSSTGGKSPTISITKSLSGTDGYLSGADWDIFNAKVSSVGVSGPLSSNGGKTPTISIAKADAYNDGYLSHADWSTFAGKQDALGFTPYNATNPAAYISVAQYLQVLDRDRSLSLTYPNTFPSQARFDFVNAGVVGTGGNYAGVLTLAPFDGKTSSTGDASYQLVFGSTAVNAGGTPRLRIRKGIDTTWNSWFEIATDANITSYALSSTQITNALNYTPVNKAGDTMGGLLTLSGAPTANLHAATKAYVDNAANNAAISVVTADTNGSWWYPMMTTQTSGSVAQALVCNRFEFQPSSGYMRSSNLDTGTISAINVYATRTFLQDGTATNPSLTFSSDGAQDTGLYWGGDGYMSFASNGQYAGQIRPGGTLVMKGDIGANGNISAPYGTVSGAAVTGPTQANADNSTNMATTAFVHSVVATVPTFTMPASAAFPSGLTGPTQANADNSTNVATTAFVHNVVATVPTFTMPTSAAFPNGLTGPTQGQADNSINVATTAYVRSAIAAVPVSSGGTTSTVVAAGVYVPINQWTYVCARQDKPLQWVVTYAWGGGNWDEGVEIHLGYYTNDHNIYMYASANSFGGGGNVTAVVVDMYTV